MLIICILDNKFTDQSKFTSGCMTSNLISLLGIELFLLEGFPDCLIRGGILKTQERARIFHENFNLLRIFLN